MMYVIAHKKTIEQMVDEVMGTYRSIGCLFHSKETRDAVAKELTKRRVKTRKGTSRGPQLHPEYVTDYVGSYHTGFGNTDYQTRWKVLYRLAIKEGSNHV